MSRCAFLGLGSEPLVADDALAVGPLAALGIQVEWHDWRTRSVSWADFDCVVVRSTWDYQHHLPDFVATLASIAAVTRLENDLSIIRRNVHKTYLADLAAAGVATVPTTFFAEGLYEPLQRSFETWATNELVVKPILGANGGDTFRLRVDDVPGISQAETVFESRGCMVQPFQESIVTQGEHSLLYFGGTFSHAVAKVPASGEFRVQEDHGGTFRGIEPTTNELDVAERALAALGVAPLYARVDLVMGPRGWCVMEVELVEPSLYLAHGPEAPVAFARAIAARLAA